MKTKRTPGILAPIAIITCVLLAHPVAALEANKNNLWYGGDEGIEIVTRTGENLAYTEEDPKIDPVMTDHARKMDQALLKIAP